MCRKHPLQDHGERASKIKAMVPMQSEFLSKSFEDAFKSKVEMLKSENESETAGVDEYKLHMMWEREQAERKGKRRLTREEEDEMKKLSRLNPSVMSIMMRDDSDGEDQAGAIERETDSDDLDSVDGDRTKKQKKEKKTRKVKKEKKAKKDKKGKKEKKEKKEKSKKLKMAKKDRSSSSSERSHSPVQSEYGSESNDGGRDT